MRLATTAESAGHHVCQKPAIFADQCGLSKFRAVKGRLSGRASFVLACGAAEAVTNACEDGCSFGALPSQFKYLPVCFCVKAMMTFCWPASCTPL